MEIPEAKQRAEWIYLAVYENMSKSITCRART
jgi:hypothetical protein